MRAVITVVGKDTVGILADVSAICAQSQANIVDVTQSILSDLFAMVMVVEIDKLSVPFTELKAQLEELGQKRTLQIHLMHEDIFNSMHRI